MLTSRKETFKPLFIPLHFETFNQVIIQTDAGMWTK